MPDSYREDRTPRHTPAGRPIEPGPGVGSFNELLTLVGAGQGVFPVGAHTRRYYPRPDVAYVPFRDAPPVEWGLLWCAETETQRVRAFAKAAFTVGVWISLEADVYAHVSKVGRGELDHTQLQFEGRLANSLEPWGERILGAPVSAGLPAGATRLQMPHVLGSPAPEIAAILNDRWRAEDVLTEDMRWALNYDPAAPRTPHRH
jgi:hypothetical protein